MEIPAYINVLFQKYLENKCSGEEVEDLLSLMKKEENRKFVHELILLQVSQKSNLRHADYDLENKLELRLKQILESDAPVVPISHRGPNMFRRWSAAVAVLLLVCSGAYFFFMKSPLPAPPLAAHVTPVKPTVSYIRHLTLPDGSSIVLHAGSKLEYPSSFSGKNREVTLYGEAYFDIAHDPSSPFIIHTGKIKTTVLGTAFNIKSDSRHVIVSVTRGKVKVEDERKVLAVLTPDQQVQYMVTENKAAKQNVNAKELVTDWTKEDMVFNGISFEEISTLLSKRYGVLVLFKNEALKKCKIRASFSGTETLEQVASVLCGIRNGTYEQLADGAIVLNGEGCD